MMNNQNTDILKLPIDKQSLRRDLYFLMSLLLADEKIHNSQIDWTSSFYEKEVTKLMLWVAVAIRSLLGLPETKNKFNKKTCGEYWSDYQPNNTSNKENLSFRQACNSVIHAIEIAPYKMPIIDAEKTIKRYYIDRITVRGKYKKKNTRTYLNVVEFVIIADELLNNFEGEDYAN